MHTFFNMNVSMERVKGVGTKTAEKLASIGIHTINDAVFFLPSSYDNYTVVNIHEAPHNEKVTLQGVVQSEPKVAFFQKGKSRLTVYVNFNGVHVKLVCFNQHYLKDTLRLNQHVKVLGKIDKNKLEMMVQKVVTQNDGISPKYALNKTMHAKTFAKIVAQVFRDYHIDYDLPKEIKEKYKLMSMAEALYRMHFPKDMNDLNEARRTIKFYELFMFQLKILEKRKRERVRSQAYIIPYDVDQLKSFVNTLPFELTLDQKKVTNEICADFLQNISMHRLLQGDVGSGKTIVAGISVYAVMTAGGQSALMVPTEVLANQHYESFLDTFKDTLNVAKLTGSTKAKEKREILSQLKSGEIDLIIGTHALIEPDVEFNQLFFTIIDEQHRFGVNQRQKLNEKATKKNILYMTATPIPRTLSITTYGDMDVSIIKQMPKGRKPIITNWFTYDAFDQLITELKRELRQGHSIYVVTPLIEESEQLDVSNAYDIYETFKDIFGEDIVTLVHGKMKNDEKNAHMHAFEQLKKKILISTTVIEVGINVPNATYMVIYDADRFGLSTLHQLRGRVGRGDVQSYCALLSNPKTESAIERLTIMTETTDGFVLSEKDLEMRGPGDYFGIRQSGLPLFKVANIVEDYRILEHARMCAVNYLK